MSGEHERKNLTFNPEVLKVAEQLMELRHFSDLSGFLSQLVREEHERRHGPVLYDATRHAPVPPARAVSYLKAKKKFPKG